MNAWINGQKIQRRSAVLKAVSLLTISAFVVSDAAWAAPLAAPITVLQQAAQTPTLQDLARDPSLVSIPFDAVTVKEFHPGTNGKFLIHIQDAHSNFSGQMSLAKALDFFMTKYGIDLVLSEGADRDVTLTDAKGSTDQETWKIVAKRYLQEGLINGEEYLNLASTHPMKIRGIEYMGLYEESLKVYADLASARAKTLAYLHRIHAVIERLKAKLYPDTLRNYEVNKSADTGSGFADSAAQLFAIADQAGISLDGFTESARLRALQSIEKEQNFASANADLEKLLSDLRAHGAGDAVESYMAFMKKAHGQQVAQGQLLKELTALAQSKGVEVPADLAAYMNYLGSFKDLRVDLLMEEIERAEDLVYKSLLSGDDQRRLRAVDRFVGLLDKAYRIRMSSADFEMYLANEEDFKTQGWEGFLNGKLIDLKYFEDLLPYQTHLEDAAQFLKKFYGLVDKRDQAFVENTNKIMAEENDRAAFLIAGGYHTEHLTQLLKEEGYTYIVLTPFVEYETDQSLYEKVLLEPLKISKKNRSSSISKNIHDTDVRQTFRALAARLAAAGGREFPTVMGARLTASTLTVVGLKNQPDAVLEAPRFGGTVLPESADTLSSAELAAVLHGESLMENVVSMVRSMVGSASVSVIDPVSPSAGPAADMTITLKSPSILAKDLIARYARTIDDLGRAAIDEDGQPILESSSLAGLVHMNYAHSVPPAWSEPDSVRESFKNRGRAREILLGYIAALNAFVVWSSLEIGYSKDPDGEQTRSDNTSRYLKALHDIELGLKTSNHYGSFLYDLSVTKTGARGGTIFNSLLPAGVSREGWQDFVMDDSRRVWSTFSATGVQQDADQVVAAFNSMMPEWVYGDKAERRSRLRDEPTPPLTPLENRKRLLKQATDPIDRYLDEVESKADPEEREAAAERARRLIELVVHRSILSDRQADRQMPDVVYLLIGYKILAPRIDRLVRLTQNGFSANYHQLTDKIALASAYDEIKPFMLSSSWANVINAAGMQLLSYKMLRTRTSKESEFVGRMMAENVPAEEITVDEYWAWDEARRADTNGARMASADDVNTTMVDRSILITELQSHSSHPSLVVRQVSGSLVDQLQKQKDPDNILLGRVAWFLQNPAKRASMLDMVIRLEGDMDTDELTLGYPDRLTALSSNIGQIKDQFVGALQTMVSEERDLDPTEEKRLNQIWLPRKLFSEQTNKNYGQELILEALRSRGIAEPGKNMPRRIWKKLTRRVDIATDAYGVGEAENARRIHALRSSRLRWPDDMTMQSISNTDHQLEQNILDEIYLDAVRGLEDSDKTHYLQVRDLLGQYPANMNEPRSYGEVDALLADGSVSGVQSGARLSEAGGVRYRGLIAESRGDEVLEMGKILADLGVNYDSLKSLYEQLPFGDGSVNSDYGRFIPLAIPSYESLKLLSLYVQHYPAEKGRADTYALVMAPRGTLATVFIDANGVFRAESHAIKMWGGSGKELNASIDAMHGNWKKKGFITKLAKEVFGQSSHPRPWEGGAYKAAADLYALANKASGPVKAAAEHLLKSIRGGYGDQSRFFENTPEFKINAAKWLTDEGAQQIDRAKAYLIGKIVYGLRSDDSITREEALSGGWNYDLLRQDFRGSNGSVVYKKPLANDRQGLGSTDRIAHMVHRIHETRMYRLGERSKTSSTDLSTQEIAFLRNFEARYLVGARLAGETNAIAIAETDASLRSAIEKASTVLDDNSSALHQNQSLSQVVDLLGLAQASVDKIKAVQASSGSENMSVAGSVNFYITRAKDALNEIEDGSDLNDVYRLIDNAENSLQSIRLRFGEEGVSTSAQEQRMRKSIQAPLQMARDKYDQIFKDGSSAAYNNEYLALVILGLGQAIEAVENAARSLEADGTLPLANALWFNSIMANINNNLRRAGNEQLLTSAYNEHINAARGDFDKLEFELKGANSGTEAAKARMVDVEAAEPSMVLKISEGLDRAEVLQNIREFTQRLEFKSEPLTLRGVKIADGNRTVAYYKTEDGRVIQVRLMEVYNERGNSRAPLYQNGADIVSFFDEMLQDSLSYDVFVYTDGDGRLRLRVYPSSYSAKEVDGSLLLGEARDISILDPGQAESKARKILADGIKDSPWWTRHSRYNPEAIVAGMKTWMISNAGAGARLSGSGTSSLSLLDRFDIPRSVATRVVPLSDGDFAFPADIQLPRVTNLRTVVQFLSGTATLGSVTAPSAAVADGALVRPATGAETLAFGKTGLLGGLNPRLAAQAIRLIDKNNRVEINVAPELEADTVSMRTYQLYAEAANRGGHVVDVGDFAITHPEFRQVFIVTDKGLASGQYTALIQQGATVISVSASGVDGKYSQGFLVALLGDIMAGLDGNASSAQRFTEATAQLQSSLSIKLTVKVTMTLASFTNSPEAIQVIIEQTIPAYATRADIEAQALSLAQVVWAA